MMKDFHQVNIILILMKMKDLKIWKLRSIMMRIINLIIKGIIKKLVCRILKKYKNMAKLIKL